jgi:hypothetical protein
MTNPMYTMSEVLTEGSNHSKPGSLFASGIRPHRNARGMPAERRTENEGVGEGE